MTRDELNRRNGFIDGHAVTKSYPWRTVTGSDFGRAIKWACKQGKKLRAGNFKSYMDATEQNYKRGDLMPGKAPKEKPDEQR